MIKAYLTTSIDGNPSNDMDSLLLNFANPAISVRVRENTIPGSNQCSEKGRPTSQEIYIKNTGNMPVSDICIILKIVDNGVITNIVYDTLKGVTIDTTVEVKRDISYIVPNKNYGVDVIAYMLCDSLLVNNKAAFVSECVFTEDIEVVSPLVKPIGTTDKQGASEVIEVTVANLGDDTYQGGVIRARIEDANYTLLLPEMSGNLPDIQGGDTYNYTFATSYTVPDVENYYIRVFIDNVDMYKYNDTIIVARQAEPEDRVSKGIAEAFTMGQNIPNPAKNTTRVEYSIPSSGEVIFNVQTVSGQILHTEVLQSDAGKQFIELNTTGFAAGIYFYSIEYQGQKLVKRMNVKN
jgi:hypothetical protein